MGKKKQCKISKIEATFTPSFLNNKESRYNSADDTNNGLYLQNFYMPEEIILHILSFVDPEKLLNYSLVCRKWNKLIKSYTIWSRIYERTYNRKAKKLPWYLYCCLLSTKYFDVNLLLNGNGQDGLNNWDCKAWEGDNYIENTPLGADPLPLDVPEFNNRASCFVTSYFNGYKSQLIKFGQSKLCQYILDIYKPHIYISEWTTGRFDCGCEYVLQCGFIGKNQSKMSVIKPLVTYFKAQWDDPKWQKMELLVTEYPEGIEGITFENSGHNIQTWKGHYGIKMAGGVVKLQFDSIEPLPYDKHGHVQPKKFSKVQFIVNEQFQVNESSYLREEDVWNGEFDDEIYYYMP